MTAAHHGPAAAVAAAAATAATATTAAAEAAVRAGIAAGVVAAAAAAAGAAAGVAPAVTTVTTVTAATTALDSELLLWEGEQKRALLCPVKVSLYQPPDSVAKSRCQTLQPMTALLFNTAWIKEDKNDFDKSTLLQN